MKSTLEVVRRWLLAVLSIGLVGTEVELILLKHTDGVWQLAPIFLIALAMVMLVWYGVTKSAASLRSLQVVMAVFLLSGAVGTIQHFRGNVAYELESNPSLSGLELYQRALTGSTPALAPGTMIQLGLIGLIFAFRHPSLVRSKQDEGHSS